MFEEVWVTMGCMLMLMLIGFFVVVKCKVNFKCQLIYTIKLTLIAMTKVIIIAN